MILLNGSQTRDTATHDGGKRLDITGRSTDQCTKTSLDHLDKGRVLREDGGSGGTVNILCVNAVSTSYSKTTLASYKTGSLRTFLDAGDARLLSVGRDWRVRCGSVLRRAEVGLSVFALEYW